MRLSALYIYPIKSLGGIPLESTSVESRGLAFDRRWMLVDRSGKALTQRDCPPMALLQPELEGGRLRVRDRRSDLPPLVLNLPPYDGADEHWVQIWNDQCLAQLMAPEADAWFSAALERPCRLVYLPEQSHRPVDSAFGQPGDEVSFADGYPFLIIGQASLADLNARLSEPVPMDRFRPNLVFSGGTPYQEESWTSFRIGEVTFRGAKICGRCQVITINQASGESSPEPLKTLAAYRREGNKVKFGLNACLDSRAGAVIRTGDPIEALNSGL